MTSLFDYLKDRTYPGRGIFIGKTNTHMVISYFIMGRSENSRNRIFENTDMGIRTRAFDESKLVDPSLIIYNPVINYNDSLIVTNGDQTNTVYDFLKEGSSFEDALRTREFEPDYPNLTPRISGIVNKDYSFKMSILKSDDKDTTLPLRYFYEYTSTTANTGRIIHTYQKDENPLPSFEGEPVKLAIDCDINEYADKLWNSLNQDNKISLYVNFIDLATNKQEVKLYNKNK